MSDVVERFLKYVNVDTQSSYSSGKTPSTQKQFQLAKMLGKELESLGAKDVYLSEECCLYAKIPSNCPDGENPPVIGFIAHMDTSPDASGCNIRPRIIKSYEGGDIQLNQEKGIVMETEKFPHMSDYIGHDLIVTDGTTLLGADDKAGIAQIITMAKYFHEHPEEKHGCIKIAFTSDEEIGKGAVHFDVDRFAADFAYTVDGASTGEVTAETFNAATALVKIHGKSIHPGHSKNRMVNAILAGTKFNSMLPAAQIPAHTEGREGFFHLIEFNGAVDFTTMKYLIRDHDKSKFEFRKKCMSNIADYLNDYYGENMFELEMNYTYYNMTDIIKPIHYIIDHVKTVMLDMGLTPREEPFRGGTDGACLTYKGLPCPNISAGFQNAHGSYEYISIQAMEINVMMLINLVRSFL